MASPSSVLKFPNPKDTNCFEVRSRHITMATMNMNYSLLLAPFVDENLLLKYNNV